MQARRLSFATEVKLNDPAPVIFTGVNWPTVSLIINGSFSLLSLVSETLRSALTFTNVLVSNDAMTCEDVGVLQDAMVVIGTGLVFFGTGVTLKGADANTWVVSS
jgi:hypothetical protein